MVQRPIVQRQRIGPAIRKLRHEQDLTLDDLAEQAGISASHLSRLERGQTLPSFTVLAGIAHVLGVSIDEFAQLEQDVAVLDTDLGEQLRSAQVSGDAYQELLSLSIEARRALVGLFDRLATLPITAKNAQDQAVRAVMENGLTGSASMINRIVSSAGLNAIGLSRALLWVDSTPGERRVLIGAPGISTYPGSDFAAVYQAVPGNLPLSPEVAAWKYHGGGPDSTRRMIVNREVVSNFLSTGVWMSGAPAASAEEIRSVTDNLISGIENGSLNLALTTMDVGNVSYIISETDVLVEAADHRGSDDSRIGLVLRGIDAAETFAMNFDSLWDQIPDDDKDHDMVRSWLSQQSGATVNAGN